MENSKIIEILLVEDNPGDVRLTQEALKDGKLKINLQVVYDGEEACNYLFKKGEYQDANRPDLIILDLNLPKKNGKEVLIEIKSNEHLKRIPVIILTTSSSEEDVANMYDLHANCFITKPLDINKFFDVVKSIENFWFTIVKMPTL